MPDDTLSKLLNFLATGLQFRPDATFRVHTATVGAGEITLTIRDDKTGEEATVRYRPSDPPEIFEATFPPE
jgi:hypothetical protein